MQLLKQNHNCALLGKQAPIKVNTKNYYLNILQSCTHVPKDDRLVLRKYICSLKLLNENNQVIATLLKYSKKGKQNVDKKLQITLRKYADKIRKNQQMHIILPKVQQIIKPIKCQDLSNSKKFCSNFQILKQSLRILSAKNSASNSCQGSTHNSNSKITERNNHYFSSKNKTNSNFFSNISNKKQQKQKKYRSPLSKISNSKNNKYVDRYLNTCFKHPTTNKLNLQNNGNRQQTPKSNKNYTTQQQFPEQHILQNISNQIMNKHKYTRSKSLQNLRRKYKDKQFNFQESEDILQNHSNFNIQNGNTIEFQLYNVGSFSKNQKTNIQTKLNVSVCEAISYSESINPLNYTITNFYSNKQYISNNTKSPHTILRDLQICSENFLQFLVPLSIRQTRRPSDLSLPYFQFINKLNTFISNQMKNNDMICSVQTIYVPFHTQYDLLTFQKLIQFIEEYTTLKIYNNPVRDLYNKIQLGLNGNYSTVYSHKRISVQQFNRCYDWKKSSVKTKFLQLIKRANQWATFITYWQFYWLKDSIEFKQFEEEFYSA